MLTGTTISNQLATMTRELAPLAIAWHVAIVVAVAAIAAGWRPSRRSVALLLVLPALSVGIVAMAYGNYFNAVSFLMLAVLAGVLGDGLAPARAEPRSAWSTWIGGGLIAYGLVYPHFVDGAWYRALWGAPIGVVPCPTLALVCGVMLVAGSSRAIFVVLVAWTAFYALFGVFVLRVSLDIGLLAAPATMLAVLRTPRTGDRDSSTGRHASHMI